MSLHDGPRLLGGYVDKTEKPGELPTHSTLTSVTQKTLRTRHLWPSDYTYYLGPSSSRDTLGFLAHCLAIVEHFALYHQQQNSWLVCFISA